MSARVFAHFISRVTARVLSTFLPSLSMNIRILFAIALSPAIYALAETASTPASELTVAPGFKVELLKSASAREGSWVSMAVDRMGRLYISPQAKAPDGGIMRVTLDAAGQVAKTDWLKPDIGAAMGMLWAFDSLYVSGQGHEGQGIYRLRDTDGDDELDKIDLLKKVPGGGGEHGAHAIVQGRDDKLYITQGNATPLVEGIDEGSPYRNFGEDVLLPRVMDPVATFFDNLKVPYGHILRTDENGAKWELFAGGFRNAYDIDFNESGELFTYDSDMEWDVGLPWYRPSRILHIVPGGEYGFREGNQKWPAGYPDSLPPVCDIGLGCPTGVKFGTMSKWPSRYNTALYVMDWTFGRILAVHPSPQGASYTAKNPLASYTHPTAPEAGGDVEVFLSGKAMPVTDLEFGRDGAMYFTVGGRGAQAALYRVSWVGKSDRMAELEAVLAESSRHAKFTQEREKLALAEKSLSEGNAAFPDGAADAFTRFTWRLAYERRPVSEWKSAALSETRPMAALTQLLALARVGDKSIQPELLEALKKFPLDSLDEELKLLKLRVIKLSFVRQGRPAEDLVKMGIEKLSRQHPAATFPLNRELSELLIWLGAPDAVEKTLALLDSAPTQEEQIWYACMLREAHGWTKPQRERYFAWFAKARAFAGGNSLPKFILRIKEQAIAKLSEAERTELAGMLDTTPAPAPAAPPAPTRPFVKAWTVADLANDLAKAGSGRNFARGKEIFSSIQCLQCHHFGQEGGNFGPDLTAVGSRFNRHDILEAIVEPSKVISEQYAAYLFTTKQGDTVMGLVLEENKDAYIVLTNPLDGAKTVVERTTIASKQIAPISLMPPGLIDVLNKDEILDLLAYIESGGNEKAPAFKK